MAIELFDMALISVIIGFIMLIVWSRVMDQSMFDTFKEIRDIVMLIFTGSK